MDEEKPNIENCQRIESPDDEIPQKYDSTECQDCTTWDCIYMPEGESEKFMQGELESMFPEGIDDGFNFSDFGD